MTSSRFEQVISSIDAANREDPNREKADGQEYPKELLYGLRMSEQLDRFQPDASEVLRIAARAQHIRRWAIPRSDYPKDRVGYLTWRRDLGRFHAEQTAALMSQAGYDPDSITRAQDLLTKKGIKQNEETQTLEDVVCLVFLKYYLEDFATQHDEDKLVAIIRKTWGKMSDRGHQAALQLALPSHLNELIGKALAQ
ncbi:DUF4202 domain-containing protein [Proteobacteria bacterium 005FR1]|nr:DUF4202 domain-containing protein [Proteobacteria bacterium 005FR1]